ncbi:PH domain-containing protein [Myxococcus qinghaiensis]|uniref:PH domain-containing protein n=1 Tax=Myxococcus qinghaiensis TaxID=2906758 RepID=UPI0020A6EE99|nr:PH domain-containing protein [Myxococcus qinghaiensis]MCP3163507.1 PH domain-containing protein [Myxococcus qinghaiensis]
MRDVPHEWLLRLLKVDPEPQLPEGTVRVFRADPRYLLYRRMLLGFKHVFALFFAVAVWVFAAQMMKVQFRELPAAAVVTRIVHTVEVLAWLGFLVVVVPVSFFVVRLDYELRWYALTDRSLRVREGIMSLREKTMTFANIQQVSIHQNPIQRMLGIADVRVESAGGGHSSPLKETEMSEPAEHLHEARFRGVSDPEAIRDAIMDCVRRHRDTGLGEPTELATSPEPDAAVPSTLEAAQELLTEVRALRSTLAEQPAPRVEPRAS